MMIKKLLLPVCLVLIFLSEGIAQDPSFSQFYANRIYLNPAFTGLENGVSVSGVSRLQWLSADRGFRTYGASAEIRMPHMDSGFGLSLFQDEAGIGQLTTSSIGISYAYTIPMDEQELHIGLQGIWVQKGVDWSKLIFSDQLDPIHGNTNQTSALPGQDRVRYTDFDMGAVWRFNSNFNLGTKQIRGMKTSVGVSLHHLVSLFNENGGGESLQNLPTSVPPRITMHAGSVIPVMYYGGKRKKIAISPNIKWDIQGESLFKFKENFQVMTYGAYVLFDGVYFGAMYQNKHALSFVKNTNAFIFAAGAHIKYSKENIYFIGFSYDANTSGVGPQAGGVYEIAFRWTGLKSGSGKGRSKMRSKKRSVDCYNFF